MHIPSLELSLHPGLYLVPTPIGNLGDITLRALQVLASVPWIAAEDTRVTQTLLRHYGIKTPMIAYHDHNTARRGPKLMQLLRQNQSVALVSDAGTPLVSDPGFELVRSCIHEGIPVIPLPGASSLLVALTGSGLPHHAFTFGGFIPTRPGPRHKFLQTFQKTPHTLVFFETARRLHETLKVCLDILGNRQTVVARELTKMFETFHRGPLQTLVEDAAMASLKGELVLVLEGAEKRSVSERSCEALLREALTHMSMTEAVCHVHQITGLSRKIVYRQALDIREK